LSSRVGRSSLVGTTNPIADLYAHRRLREVLAIKRDRVIVVYSSNKTAVDIPLDSRRGPVQSVCVPLLTRASNVGNVRSVVGSSVTLSKEVGLNSGTAASYPLPVDLIKVVRLKDKAANNTGSISRFGDYRDISEEDVLCGADCRGFKGFFDHEVGSISVIGNNRTICKGPVLACALREVSGNGSI
jgi:hypothetical protein